MASPRTAGRVVIIGARTTCRMRPASRSPRATCGAMVVFTGLGTISEDGLEGEDRYIIHLWPGWGNGTTVLKQWDEEANFVGKSRV